MTILALDPGLVTGYAVLTRNGHALTLDAYGVWGPFASNRDGMRGREATRAGLDAMLRAEPGVESVFAYEGLEPPFWIDHVALEQRREGMGAHSIPAEGAWDAVVPFAGAVNRGATWDGKPIGWFSPAQWQKAIGRLAAVDPDALKLRGVQRKAIKALIGENVSAIKGPDAPHILDAILIGVAYAARKGWRPAGWKPAKGEKARNPLADRVREKVEAAKGGRR